MNSGKSLLLHVDKKGRIHVPAPLRKELGIEGDVLAEKHKNTLLLQPMKPIRDPVAFLSSINVKTTKTPVEMKREAEGFFGT